MNVAVQIPIKARSSTRVPNKNFRDLCGKPFSCWLLDEVTAHCPDHWHLYIDSERPTTYAFFEERYGERLRFHQRADWFAGDQANGNHLIHQFACAHPQYDLYVQLFVTAVTLTGTIITEAVEALANARDEHDSVVMVTEETGWFWHGGKPLNYDPHRPDGLPRSQDALVLQETTGLYGITRDAVLRTGCRIGRKPLFYRVDPQYAFDVDTMHDFREAQERLSERTLEVSATRALAATSTPDGEIEEPTFKR